MLVDKEFWKNRRVLITGHTGFKGSWLLLWLKHLGAEVTGFSLEAPTTPSLFEATNIDKDFNHVIGDIRNLNSLFECINTFAPELVIHMAAQSLVFDSYIDPVSTYQSNVMGTINLFEAIRKTDSVKAVLNITTDKCYENKEWIWGYKETDPLGGYDPYSSSKACSEIISESYRQSFFSSKGVLMATARAGNVIGGGDWSDNRIIPDAIRSFSQGRPLIVRSPLSIRPWQHVLEPISGYLAICQKLINGEDQFASSWNFGPNYSDNREVSILADLMVDNWGGDAKWELDKKEHYHEAQQLKLDCSKSNFYLKWSPKWALDVSVDKTISWYKAFYNGQDMNEFSLKQILEYQEKCSRQGE
jgi:CDP-glucose 4,6-dehydratase